MPAALLAVLRRVLAMYQQQLCVETVLESATASCAQSGMIAVPQSEVVCRGVSKRWVMSQRVKTPHKPPAQGESGTAEGLVRLLQAVFEEPI